MNNKPLEIPDYGLVRERIVFAIRILAVLLAMGFSMPGCGSLFQKDKDLKKYKIQEEQYTPYKLKNSIEG